MFDHIKLRPDQIAAAEMLHANLLTQGDKTFGAPVGMGKSIVLGHALHLYKGQVVIISRLDVLRDQTIHLFARMGVGDHVHFHLKRGKLPDLSMFDLIVATACMRDTPIDHTNVLRIK